MELLNHQGEEINAETFADDIKTIHFPNNEYRSVVLASDMDNTMFDNDLGTLVFLEKMDDPKFWHLDIDEFRSLLLPKKYRGLLEKGAEKKVDGLHPPICKLALDLAYDIVNLYEKIRASVAAKRPNGEGKLSEEFARKMIELDRIFVLIDGTLSKNLNGQILMRTRFFAGKNPSAITTLAQKVMHRHPTNIGRRIALNIHDENSRYAEQIVTEDRITQVHGAPSPYQEIDRYVKPISVVQGIIHEAVQRLRIPAVVATGNLKAIAKTAITESDYSFLLKQKYVREGEGSAVVGTWLRSGENGTLHPKVEGKPVLWDRKAEEALKFAKARRRDLKIALGDSPSTDGPMLRSSLANGGVAVVVGKDIDSLRRRFEKVVPKEQRYQEKVYYVVEDK
ncbi:hypothetical protein IT413_05755 [Candidatus Peregrinibacteria bacterium]|nr:hypothetical protein [Candidatus Peregrinibacteria bacterium]